MLSRKNLLALLLSLILVMILVPAALGSTYYTVKDGDNLWNIACKHNTTVDKLVKLNGLKSDALQPGMRLLVNNQATTVVQTPSRAATRVVKPLPSRSGSAITGQDIIALGARYLGTPYVYGGSGPGGFDCSGFVSYVYGQYGYQLPRTAAGMAGVGTVISKENLQCGDLVLFQGTAGPGITHVGIYVGSGQFIHSSSGRRRGVVYSSVYDSYYTAHYYGGRRIIENASPPVEVAAPAQPADNSASDDKEDDEGY